MAQKTDTLTLSIGAITGLVLAKIDDLHTWGDVIIIAASWIIAIWLSLGCGWLWHRWIRGCVIAVLYRMISCLT
jgi:hypothetical protein